MGNFAYLKSYGVVGSIIWEQNGLYKIVFFHENQNKVEIFIPSEIKLRSTDGYEEMAPSEIRRFVKSGKLKERELEKFSSVISKFERTDIYLILESLRSFDIKLFESLKQMLEDNKII
jgi:hypothetical protein